MNSRGGCRSVLYGLRPENSICLISMTVAQGGRDLQRNVGEPARAAVSDATAKKPARTPVKTVFGPVPVPNPRRERCSCQTEDLKTFRPTAPRPVGAGRAITHGLSTFEYFDLTRECEQKRGALLAGPRAFWPYEGRLRRRRAPACEFGVSGPAGRELIS